AVLEGDRLELPVLTVHRGDLAPVAYRHTVAVEVPSEVVGHCLAQVVPAMEEGHECAPAGEPDGGLSGGIAASDYGDPGRAAELRLRRPRRVADRHSLVVREPVARRASILRTGREE